MKRLNEFGRGSYKPGFRKSEEFIFVPIKAFSEKFCSELNLKKFAMWRLLKIWHHFGLCNYNNKGIYLHPELYRFLFGEVVENGRKED